MSSVEHMVRLLSLFVDEPELGVREMSRRLALAKSSVHRMACELARAEFLEQDPVTRRYRLGLRLLELGGLVQARNELTVVAEPVLKALMRTSGETTHLSVLDGLEIVYVARIESNQSIRMFSRVGQRGPLYCTGSGKVVLAHQDPAFIDRVVAHGLHPYTPRTITDPAALREHLRQVRTQGYAVNEEERELGVSSLAAPIHDAAGTVTAAISIAGPAQRLTRERMRALIDPLIRGAEHVSRQLGWRGPSSPAAPAGGSSARPQAGLRGTP
jgi:DNA-binding IclR family transcriptional regulator